MFYVIGANDKAAPARGGRYELQFAKHFDSEASNIMMMN